MVSTFDYKICTMIYFFKVQGPGLLQGYESMASKYQVILNCGGSIKSIISISKLHPLKIELF